MVRPSATDSAQSWLAQFDVGDRPAAIALLDSIRVASASSVVAGIRGTLENYLASSRHGLPAAVFPVLAKQDMLPLDPEKPLPESPIAFVDFDPSQSLSAEAGSEALIANLVREVARPLPKVELIRQAQKRPITIDSLYAARCRALVLVTDYIGSGQQVAEYVRAWQRNPRIRSWISFGWLRIVVVAFAASGEGLQRVRDLDRPPEVLIHEAAPSTAAPAEWIQARKIEELCRNYASRARLRRPALGFRGSAGLFATAFSVPNNLPAILIESAPGRWVALFEGRTMSAEVSTAIGDFVPSRDIAYELRLARQSRLASRISDTTVNSRWADHLTVLALLPAEDEHLSQHIGKSLPEVRATRLSLIELGLVDSKGHPTDQGRRELQISRRGRRAVTAGLIGSDLPYYPRLTR